MTPKLAIALTTLCALAVVTPVQAKTKAAKKPTGIFCEQGSQNITFGTSQLKPGVRSRLRIGQKATINVAGVGPLKCRVF